MNETAMGEVIEKLNSRLIRSTMQTEKGAEGYETQSANRYVGRHCPIHTDGAFPTQRIYTLDTTEETIRDRIL